MTRSPGRVDRWPVLGVQHLAASSHPAVSAVGVTTLAQGGNALDATLAMAAMCWLALPGQCGVGGDAFAIVRDPDGRVWTVGGSGFGPDGADAGYYRAHGLGALPLSGALSVAAPGAIGAMRELHARGATRTLAELWSPAADAADRGMPCSAKTRDDIVAHEDALRSDDGARAAFLPGGRVPAVGDRLGYRELAGTIRRLAEDPDSLYTGELADQAVATLAERGAPFSGEEWALSGRPLIGPAVAHAYGSFTVHATPPPSPGWMLLQQAALLDGTLAGVRPLGVEFIDALAWAARRAFADRWDRCGSDNSGWQQLLEPTAIHAAREERDRQRRTEASALGIRAGGDTTSTVVVDNEGRAVSFIQSLAFTFGAHLTIPGTGVLLNNRLGRGAYLVEGHPNEVRPRRRPLHTLNAWVVTDAKDRLAHVGNTPGGDGQVQWNMQLLSHLIDFGSDPQTAVSAPRFTVAPGSDANEIGRPEQLICEARIDDDILAALGSRGHDVRKVGPWAAGGSALVISADQNRGVLAGGADPRMGGVVSGA